MAAKFFCYEDSLGIFDAGVYQPVKNFDQTRFRKIIKDLIGSRRHHSADLLLKEAIMLYLDVKEQVRHYKRKGITDSVFYMRWRKEILEDSEFKTYSVELQKKAKEVFYNAKKNRKKELNYRSFIEARDKTAKVTLARHHN